MKEAFIEKRFNASSRVVIKQANQIIAEYQAKGFTLTLRQLYYQFVARGLFIVNTVQMYKRLGSIINDARLAGLVDWNAIEDRTRNVQSPNDWASPDSLLAASAEQYQEDTWLTQDRRCYVLIEKEALVGVVEGICQEYRVPFLACRGYLSQSEAYSLGKKLKWYQRVQHQRPIILHLGDHDPSGIDMTRDNNDRLDMFARDGIEVRRLALNMAQIEEHNPPPNPAKETDSRFANYQALHGDESWELDALDPQLISDLIRDAIDSFRDVGLWDEAMQQEEVNRALLRDASENWDDVKEFLRNRED